MAPHNRLSPWAHPESWADGFSIAPPRPNHPSRPVIRGRDGQRARASTTIPAVAQGYTRRGDIGTAAIENVPGEAMGSGATREQQASAHQRRRHTESSIASGGRPNLTFGLAPPTPTRNFPAHRNSVAGGIPEARVAGRNANTDSTEKEHSEAISSNVNTAEYGGQSTAVVSQSEAAGFRRRRSNSVFQPLHFASDAIPSEASVEEEAVEDDDPIAQLQPVTSSEASLPLRSRNPGFRRPRSQNVSEHRCVILPPTAEQIEEINRTPMSKEARVEALRVAINPQRFGVPRAVLELRARLVADADARPGVGDTAVFIDEGWRVEQQSLQGTSVMGPSKGTNAQWRDDGAECIRSETVSLHVTVRESSVAADINDPRAHSATEVLRRLMGASLVNKPGSERPAINSPAPGLNSGLDDADAVVTASVTNRLHVLNDTSPSPSLFGPSFLDDSFLQETRGSVPALDVASLLALRRDTKISDASVSTMEHFARPYLLGDAIPTSAANKFNTKPLEASDGAALMDIFNANEVAHDPPNTAFIEDDSPVNGASSAPDHYVQTSAEGYHISDAHDVKHSEVLGIAQRMISGCHLGIDWNAGIPGDVVRTEGRESPPDKFGPLGDYTAFIAADAPLSHMFKPDEEVTTPNAPKVKVSDRCTQSELRDTPAGVSSHVGDSDHIFHASNAEHFRHTEDSALYRRVQAAYEGQSQHGPGEQDPTAAMIGTESGATAGDDILRSLTLSLGGSEEMASLVAGTLTGQLPFSEPLTDNALDITTLPHPQSGVDSSFPIPAPTRPTSTDEDEIRLHNAVTALDLETAHHNAVMTVLQTQAAACRLNMQNEPWSPENNAVFEERIEGYKHEAHEEVARHEMERDRLEKKIDEAREEMA